MSWGVRGSVLAGALRELAGRAMHSENHLYT